MLSSRKPLEPRRLHGSNTKVILLSQSRTGRRPSSALLSFPREFSWGSKHKYTASRAGKVCKGFSTRYFADKNLTRKQVYQSPPWNHHHLRQCLPRCAPIKEWRFLSSWGKKPETSSNSRNKAETNEVEDWYTRWERQKLRQYDDFIKKVEHDPYTALFGKSWLRFHREDTEPNAAGTKSTDPSKESSVPTSQRPPESWRSKSRLGGTDIFKDRDVCERQPKPETILTQEHHQEYEIDPITNRKVLKTSASPASTAGHIKPLVQDVEKASETNFARWSRVSPTSLDRRSAVVEHAQSLSGSYPPSKDTPPLEPHNGSGWLAQEGFGSSQKPEVDDQPTYDTHDTKPKTTARKIESALDRHLSRKSTKEEKNDRPQLQYRPEENKTEDVDLLRPSDVRASAGLRGNSPRETDIDKQARRQKLEEKYDDRSLDRAGQLNGEAASNELMQKSGDQFVEKSTATELRYRSWLKSLQDAKLRDKEASKDSSAVWVNEVSDARDFDPVSVHQQSDSTPAPKDYYIKVPTIAARDKASKLKAQIVPFKAKLDAMKADYDSLRQQWLQEIRRVKEKAAKKEEEVKAQRSARFREVHEEEVKSQKVAMEAMEMRRSDGSTNKTSLVKGIGNDGGEKPAVRRLQSFLQGEGDMASNVHEFAGRDRWYKRKAPHAMDAKDVEMDAKLQKLATDKALIREVRDIYEDTYGTIDTKHRQTPVLPNPSMKESGQPTSTSSGGVPQQAKLPSSTAIVPESSQGLDESQSSEVLKIIQKLFVQLHEAQSVIQEYRRQTKHAWGPSDLDTNIIKTSSAFEESVIQIVRTSEQLARLLPGGTIDHSSVEAMAASSSTKPTINRPLSTTAPETTNLEVQKAPKLNTYCVLAYDSATQTVKSADATTLAPFLKEESLLPFDALKCLSNPGRFLPHVMSLGDKGYELVSGTSNILVFKKEVTPEELAEIKKTDARKESTPSGSGFQQIPNIDQHSIRNIGGGWHYVPPSQKDAQECCEAIHAIFTAKQQQALANIEEKHQKAEAADKTAMDDTKGKEQPFEEAQKQQCASSSSPSHTSSDKVHRQETVFSGSRQGRWVDHSVKAKKGKRRRRKIVKRILTACAYTAACCYAVGVASEMIQSW